MKDIEAYLEGFGQIWKPGQHLANVEVTLGQNEKSSNCQIMLSDPLGLIAAALINHSIKSGGIQQLPNGTGQASNITVPPVSTSSADGSQGVVAQGEAFTPQVKAFLDLIAVREVGGYFPNRQISRGWYFIALNGVTFTEAEAMRPEPPYARFPGTKAAGRYQIIPQTWDFIRSRNPGKFKDFSPESQDRAAYWLMSSAYRKMVPHINAGNIREAIRLGRNEWTSLPGAAEQQAGWTMDKAIAYYNERLKFYQGGATAVQPTPKVEPEKPKETTSKPEVAQEPIKGNKLVINWGQVSFEFFHQGTEWSEQGITKVTGQGIRWVLNRRKRNKTIKNTSLRELASKIAAAHKVKLDWQAAYDPQYEHIDQSGISDYQLLHREANFAGLWVTESTGTLIVKSRDKIQDTGFTVSTKVNLIKYTIADKALDPNNSDNSVLLQDETKATVEPVTGKMVTQAPDVDTTKSQDSTGKVSKEIAGKPKPGQDAVMAQNRAKMKRIKGLPSSFVVTLSDTTLTLRPPNAIRTKDFPEPLNRIWMIDKVTHNAAEQVTTLEVYSPVEILDTTPVTPTTNTSQPQGEIPITPGQWVYPASGFVTSLFGLRRSPGGIGSTDHRGADIGNPSGTPILAAADGVATFSLGFNGGAGNLITIKHTNGYTTRYFHLLDGSIRVTQGQQVSKGQQIAGMGTTGNSTGVHLHFEIFPPGVAIARGNQINPSKIFPKLGTRMASIMGGTSPS